MIDTRMQKLTKNEHGRNIVNYSWIQVCRNSEKNSTFPFFQHLFSILNSCDKLKVFFAALSIFLFPLQIVDR